PSPTPTVTQSPENAPRPASLPTCDPAGTAYARHAPPMPAAATEAQSRAPPVPQTPVRHYKEAHIALFFAPSSAECIPRPSRGLLQPHAHSPQSTMLLSCLRKTALP